MESSLPQQKRRTDTRRWLITSFLIYGMMVAGLLGYFAVYSDDVTHETAVDTTAVAAAKPGRYQAVIANWNRYRGKVARADAR
jgi:hypothetical protein